MLRRLAWIWHEVLWECDASSHRTQSRGNSNTYAHADCGANGNSDSNANRDSEANADAYSNTHSNPNTAWPRGRDGWLLGHHPDAWCVSSIALGCQTYTESQAIAIMLHSTGGDMTYQLGAQLAAAKLNVGCAGTNSSCVASTIAAADSWLCSHPIGSNVTANSQVWRQITSTYNTLTDYNEGHLCAPPRK